MTVVDQGTENVSRAVETSDKVASHLHPTPSYDLARHPMPTGLEEVWRFTPLKRLRGLLDDQPGDGELTWETDLPDGVALSRISNADAERIGEALPADRPSALAVARSGGAVLVDVPADAVLDRPLVLRLVGKDADQLVWGHTVVRIGAHAKATVVVEHQGSARYASQTSVLVGDGARADLVTLQLWDDDAVHLGHDAIRVGRDASVRHSAVSFGGDLVRLNTTVSYAGPAGEAELLGMYFADADQHLEHRLFVDHNAPHTRSNVDYRGALQGAGAHTVWIGDVLIRKVAEAISTYENNRNLVLTDGCRADSVPNLEIETGQIEGAGHASATGRFDDEQLFYLQSRGVAEDVARRLVVHGFFAALVRRIGVPGVEERLLRAVEDELERSVGLPPASATGAA